jgi:2-polyprenyl-3-methyl-5-hydroxy-6-metoxy-1,4-benzoquinol methylase
MENIFSLRCYCPSCNNEKSEIIFIENYSDERLENYLNLEYSNRYDKSILKNEKFVIKKCLECGFFFQEKVFTDQYQNILYNEWFDQHEALNDHILNGKWKKEYYRSILNFVSCYFNGSKNLKVLDFGAGFGDSLLISKELGFKPFAVEYSFDRISYLRKNGIEVLDSTENMQFDFVILDQVLEHYVYPQNLLNEIYSKLNKNGIFYLSVPNSFKFHKKIRLSNKVFDVDIFENIWRKANMGPFSHINFFNSNSLKILVKNSGFKIIFPWRQCLTYPISFKSFLRPIFNYFFGTSLFLKKRL